MAFKANELIKLFNYWRSHYNMAFYCQWPIKPFTEISVSLALALNFFVNNSSRRSSRCPRTISLDDRDYVDVNPMFLSHSKSSIFQESVMKKNNLRTPELSKTTASFSVVFLLCPFLMSNCNAIFSCNIHNGIPKVNYRIICLYSLAFCTLILQIPRLCQSYHIVNLRCINFSQPVLFEYYPSSNNIHRFFLFHDVLKCGLLNPLSSLFLYFFSQTE